MESGDRQKSTSDVLESVVTAESKGDTITLSEIRHILHERGFALLLLLFALPLSIPLPVPPGSTTILALPMMFLSFQVMIGYDSPWLPRFLGERQIKRKTLAFLIEKTVPILRKVEKFTSPRIPIFNNILGERIFGILSLICSISIAIPLPLTNFIPAAGVGLMSLSVLSRDGLVGMAGILVSLIGLSISGLVIFLGHKFVTELLSWIF